MKWKSTRNSIFDQRAVLAEKDFFSKPSKVLHLTTSEISTASLNKSFWVRVLLKREKASIYTNTLPTYVWLGKSLWAGAPNLFKSGRTIPALSRTPGGGGGGPDNATWSRVGWFGSDGIYSFRIIGRPVHFGRILYTRIKNLALEIPLVSHYGALRRFSSAGGRGTPLSGRTVSGSGGLAPHLGRGGES